MTQTQSEKEIDQETATENTGISESVVAPETPKLKFSDHDAEPEPEDFENCNVEKVEESIGFFASYNYDCDKVETEEQPKVVISWRSTTLIFILHIMAIRGAYLILTWQIFLGTFISMTLHGWAGMFGVTAGAHRLWAHKTYKAKLPLQILLAWWQTIGVQNSIWEWSRDHRVHHKFSETNADPHNVKRGFFFAHMGWLMCRKHEDVKIKGKTVNLSDLEANPVVMFQKKYYISLVYTFGFVVPTLIPWYFFGENFATSWMITMFRYCLSLHLTWLVNSAAHLWGDRPYDKEINPSQNLAVSILTGGEGWHNYHHVFPWDYKASEFGFYLFSPTTLFIDIFAAVGQAYALKTVPKSVVQLRMQRTGDIGNYSRY